MIKSTGRLAVLVAIATGSKGIWDRVSPIAVRSAIKAGLIEYNREINAYRLLGPGRKWIRDKGPKYAQT